MIYLQYLSLGYATTIIPDQGLAANVRTFQPEPMSTDTSAHVLSVPSSKTFVRILRMP